MSDITRKIPSGIINEGTFLKLVQEMQNEDNNEQAIYDLISHEDVKKKAETGNCNWTLAFTTEAKRIQEKRYIHEWKIDNSLERNILILRKLPDEETFRIKIKRYISQIKSEVSVIEKLIG